MGHETIGVVEAIADAYHSKYDRHGPRIVGSVGPDAEAATIRLVPRVTT